MSTNQHLSTDSVNRSNDAPTPTASSDTPTDPEFQEGLRKIINSYESQLGRTLEAEELANIVKEATRFYTDQQRIISDQQQQQYQHQPEVEPSSTSSNPTQSSSAPSIDQDPNQPYIRREGLIDTNGVTNVERGSGADPPYPMNFHELARLISSSTSTIHDTEQLLSVLSSQTNLSGLRSIPNKLNESKPSPPVLAHKVGAGKKPWENSGSQNP